MVGNNCQRQRQKKNPKKPNLPRYAVTAKMLCIACQWNLTTQTALSAMELVTQTALSSVELATQTALSGTTPETLLTTVELATQLYHRQ